MPALIFLVIATAGGNLFGFYLNWLITREFYLNLRNMKNIKGLYNISRTKLFVMWLSITAISFVLSEMGSLYDRIQGIMSLIEDYKRSILRIVLSCQYCLFLFLSMLSGIKPEDKESTSCRCSHYNIISEFFHFTNH